MKLTDVTPEWISERRKALELKDVDIYTAIDMPQDQFSKAMNGRRDFRPAELEAILEYLTSEEAASSLPTVVAIRSDLPLLSEDDQGQILALVKRLLAQH